MKNAFRLLSLLIAAMMILICFTFSGCKKQRDFSDSSLWGDSLSGRANSSAKEYETGLFDTSYVHTVDIEISEEDWADLIAHPLEKTKYKVNVTIDGKRVENVSFATKGNTSLAQVATTDSNRYSFKINFGKYEKGQTYQGLNKLNLNNMMSDATCMKDYLSYLIMRKAGASASLTSYAALSINGELHGLYIAIEDVSKAFLERNYGDSSGALYKPETERLANVGDPGEGGFPGGENGVFPQDGFPGGDQRPDGQEGYLVITGTQPPMPEGTFPPDQGGMPGQMPGGQMPGGQIPGGQMPGGFGSENAQGADLVYIDDQTSSYSSIFDNEENSVSDEDEAELIAALKTLSGGENIGSSWDMRQVIRYFAAHNFVLNYDSYTGNMLHNYYLYEKGGTIAILPWDYNLAFGGFVGGADASSAVNLGIDSPLSGAENESRPLWNVILNNKEYLSYYHECYDSLLKNFFENGDCTKELKRVYDMIRPYVENDPSAFYSISEFDTAYNALVRFCELRAESIRKQLKGKLSTVSSEQKTADRIDASGLDISAMGTQGGGDSMNGPGGDPGGNHPGVNPRDWQPGQPPFGQPGEPPGGQPGNPPGGQPDGQNGGN